MRGHWGFVGAVAIVVLAGAAGSCGSGEVQPRAAPADVESAPIAVTEAAAVIGTTARAGQPGDVADLAGDGFEFDFARPDTSFADHLRSSTDGWLLDRLAVVVGFAPGRRLSPYGNGSVQELWVFPGLALTPVSEWTVTEIDAALAGGLLTAAELAEYREEKAYLGFSVGLAPNGDWVFFTSGRVGRTQK